MSETAKHTPGPWFVSVTGNSRTVRHVSGTVARLAIAPDSNRSPEGEANAHLMAAAPDMREALATLKTCDLSDLPGDVVAMIDAAIAKTGATP